MGPLNNLISSNPEYLLYGGLALTGTSYAREKFGRATDPAGQAVSYYTGRHQLPGVVAGVVLHHTLKRGLSLGSAGKWVGLSVALAGTAADFYETKLSPTAIITGNLLTGVAAYTAMQVANPVIDIGLVSLQKFMEHTKQGSFDTLTNWVSKLKTQTHPVLSKYISRTGVLGLITAASVPIAHKVIQRAIAGHMRKTQTNLFNLNQAFNQPDLPEPPREGEKYLPGNIPPNPNLNMVINYMDHVDSGRLREALR
jgi:hypothetical protein